MNHLPLLLALVSFPVGGGAGAWLARRRHTPRHARTVLELPGDPGGWDEDDALDRLTAVPWSPERHHEPPANWADLPSGPAPHYTELDAWEAEQRAAAELLDAETSELRMLGAIVQGLEYRNQIDQKADLIRGQMLALLGSPL